MFIKNKTKVACGMMVLSEEHRLLFETNNEQFSLGRVMCKKICRPPGGNYENYTRFSILSDMQLILVTRILCEPVSEQQFQTAETRQIL